MEYLFMIPLALLVAGNIATFVRFYKANKKGKKIAKINLIFSIAWVVVFFGVTVAVRVATAEWENLFRSGLFFFMVSTLSFLHIWDFLSSYKKTQKGIQIDKNEMFTVICWAIPYFFIAINTV